MPDVDAPDFVQANNNIGAISSNPESPVDKSVIHSNLKHGSDTAVETIPSRPHLSQDTIKPLDIVKLLSVQDRKMSCTAANTMSTCVNKASAHLELLQTLIEEWFVDTEEDAKSVNNNTVAPTELSSDHYKPVRSTNDALAVSGVGVAVSTKSSRSVQKKSIADELPYLGGMEVIEEVASLMAKLETDRQTTEQNLFNEKQRGKALQKKLDDLAKKRAEKFPFAVQTEHDAAVADLNELNWHVTYKGRMEEKLQERVEHANVFNERLQDDIAFVQKHCPLVEEKLSLELQTMQKIKDAQDETDRELELTLERLAKTKVRNEEAHIRAGQERENMAKEIEQVNQELDNAIIELSDARDLFNSYTHQTTETRKQIQENVEEKKVLSVRRDNSKMAENMQRRKIDDLTNKIRMIETERHKLEEEAFNKQRDLDVLTNTMESQYNELKKACEHEEQRLKKITQETQDRTIEIDNLLRKINKCEQTISEDEKTVRRMNNQIHNTESMMNQMLDEHNKVQLYHQSVRDRLQEEKEKISQIEDSLRHTLETLKKQCKDEIQTRGTLNSRITSDGEELVKSQAEAKQKKEKLSKTIVEIEEQLKVVVKKVDKLRGLYDAKKQILDGLESEIRETKEAKVKVEEELIEAKEELNPYLEKLKREYNARTALMRALLQISKNSLEKHRGLQPIRLNAITKEITYGLGHQTAEITSDLRQLTELYQVDSHGRLTLTISLSQLPIDDIQKDNVDIQQEISKLSNQMELMARKKDEMDHSARILKKSIKQNEVAVERLKKELTEYSTQLEDQTRLYNNLVSAREDITRRTEIRQKEHQHLMSERYVSVKTHTDTLQSELDTNKSLAEKYRKLQGQYVDLKSHVMDMFDERNRLEASIKDLKQLKGLQNRMRRALETYYKFRGLFNVGELERVETENKISAKKVSHLQDNFKAALVTIASFLQGQMRILDSRQVVKEYKAVTVENNTASNFDITT